MSENQPLVWIDLEMTGLNPDHDVIIEIATIVTDSQLNVIAEGPNLAIHHPDEVMAKMDEWNTTHHGQSGLTQRVKESTIDTQEAERQTLEFIAQHCEPGQAPLCGNSVHQDRRFLYRYMANLEEYLHYRIVDVSTVKELARRWQPDLLGGFKKSGAHLALDDIRESIGELKYYRDTFFK